MSWPESRPSDDKTLGTMAGLDVDEQQDPAETVEVSPMLHRPHVVSFISVHLLGGTVSWADEWHRV